MKILWHSDINEVRGLDNADEESGLTRVRTVCHPDYKGINRDKTVGGKEKMQNVAKFWAIEVMS